MRLVLSPVDHIRRLLTAILVVLGLVWLLFGGPLYIVGPEEEGIVLTLGRHTATTGPGLHLKMPWPVQRVYTPAVNVVQRVEIGFRTIDDGPPPEFISFENDQEMLSEGQMLTGDENIINVAAIVQYRISDAHAYLFNLRAPEEALRDIAEAVIRQVIGDNAIDAVLTTGKADMQIRIADQVQQMSDSYGMGIDIVAVQLMDVQPPSQVSSSFKDVATAREDMQAYINEAQAYRNDVLPSALADSVRMVNEALGYQAMRVGEAMGEASRFAAVASEYARAPGVTATRLHLETLEAVLSAVSITIVDGDAGALTHYNLSEGQ
ncbi:FtsH protease activity modulator HflK [Candidatus Fermentibacteria bacterium]|nr:FtsH protease activity modulator HflK [Candidatus Fermentibacteria bacterium]